FERRCARRGLQAGFAILIEMLIASMVLVTIAAIALPNLVRLHWINQQTDAKLRLQQISNAKTALITCQSTPNCNPSPALLAIIPAQGSMQTSGYVYSYSETTDWLYTATPVLPTTGQDVMHVGTSTN